MQEKEKNIPPLITLAAGMIACVMCMIRRADLLATLEIVLIVLVVFYIVGVIVKKIVGKINRDAEKAAVERERELKEQAAKELEEQQALEEAGGEQAE